MKISQTAREAAERIARLANDPRLTTLSMRSAPEIVQSAIDAEMADLHAKDSVRTKEHNILTQENRRLAEDAARLDWLDLEGAIPLAVSDSAGDRWQIEWCFSPDGCSNKTATGPTLRAAIDAAREKSAP